MSTLEILPKSRNRTWPGTSGAPPMPRPNYNTFLPSDVTVSLSFAVIASFHFRILCYPSVHRRPFSVFLKRKKVISFKFLWFYRLFLHFFFSFIICLLSSGHFPDWILLISYSWCSSTCSSDLSISYKLSAGSRSSIRLRFCPYGKTINSFGFLY